MFNMDEPQTLNEEKQTNTEVYALFEATNDMKAYALYESTDMTGLKRQSCHDSDHIVTAQGRNGDGRQFQGA